MKEYSDEGDSELSKNKLKMIRDYIESNRFVAEQKIFRKIEQIIETYNISREDARSIKELVMKNLWLRAEGERVMDREELDHAMRRIGEQELTHKKHAEKA